MADTGPEEEPQEIVFHIEESQEVVLSIEEPQEVVISMTTEESPYTYNHTGFQQYFSYIVEVNFIGG
jgi:hypothetical protein